MLKSLLREVHVPYGSFNPFVKLDYKLNKPGNKALWVYVKYKEIYNILN